MAKIALALTLALSTLAGCGAARSALGALGGGGSKPTANVTVVNEVNVPPPVAQAERKQKSSAKHAVIGGAIAGTIVGAVIGAMDSPDAEHIGAGMAIGAAAGAGIGYATH